MNIQDFDPAALSPGEKAKLNLHVLRLPSGLHLDYTALVARGARAGKTIVVIAGVHGDEYEGPLTILKVFEQLDPDQMQGTFIGIPVVNPPAFDAGTRPSPIDGQNLARIFPGRPDGTISERIAHALLEYLFPHADLLLDHHSGGVQFDIPLTCGYYLLEGEIGRVSKEAARAFGAEVLWGSPLNKGRTISEAVRHKQVPSIYTETTGAGGVLPADLEAYIRGTLNVMKYLGILPGAPEGSEPEIVLESSDPNRDFDSAINCTASGLLETMVRLKARVNRGDLIARIYDLSGNVLEEIHADQPGVVLGLRRFARVFSGELIALVE